MPESKNTMADYIGRRINLKDLSSSMPLLRLLEGSGPLSQPEAAKRLGMSTGSCNLHFQRLENEGLIHRVDKISSGRGRPTVVWDFNRAQNACMTLVYDVPFFQGALLDYSGKLIDQVREDLTSITTRQELLKRTDAFLERAKHAAEKRGVRIHHVFAALPGLLTSPGGKVKSAVNFPQMNGLDLQKHVPDTYGWPCKAGPLGLAFYHGETLRMRSRKRVMMIHWDLGLGILFGEGPRVITHGTEDGPEHLCFPELGHTRIGRGPVGCHCGRTGCLEAHAGGWAVLRDLDDPGIRSMTDLVWAACDGHPGVLDALRKAARLLAEELLWPLQLMRAEVILVSGPMAPAVARVRDSFHEGLSRVLGGEELERLEIRISKDPERSMREGAFVQAKRLFLNA